MLCIRNMYPSFIVYSRVTESDGFPILVSTIIMTNLGKNIYNISQVCGCNPRRLFYWKHFWWNKFLENFFFWKKYCLYYIKSNWSSRFWKINYLWLVFILVLWHTGFFTRDETSETILRNLYCLFSYIHDSLEL